VTVNPLPTAFNVTGGGSYCSGGPGVPVGLDGSQVGVNYQLKKDGVDTGAPVAGTGAAITFGNQTAAGIYTVEATNPVTTCKATMTGSATVTVILVTANFTFTPTAPCVGDLVQFTDASTSTGGSIVSRTWNFGDGAPLSTVANPTHTYTVQGNYTVTLNVTDVNGCTASVSKVIKIALVTADFTFTPPKPCVGDKIQFTDGSSSTGGSIASWSWSFGDASPSDLQGGTSTLQNPIYTYATAGTYTVTLTATDAVGCKATKTKQITVLPADHVAPFCGFTIDGNNIIVLITDQDDAGSGGGIAEVNFPPGITAVADRPFIPCVTKYIKYTIPGPANFLVEIKDCCGNTTVCDPLFFTAEASGSGRYEFKVSNMDKYIYVHNDGLAKIDFTINNRRLELVADPIRRYQHGTRQYMPLLGDIVVDVTSYMTEAENNVIVQVTGPLTAIARIIFADFKLPTTPSAILPQEFTLLQNYPNPFNPSTTIEYTVPATFAEGVKVELVIYNALGQKIKTLENGIKPPNLYSVLWNGTDEFGRVVPTGIYFYRIRVGDFITTKRMSLMK